MQDFSIWYDRAAAERAVAIYREQFWDQAPAGYYFDEEAAMLAVDMYPRKLRFSKGEWYGRRFVLEDWQAARLVVPVFGWKRPDGTRRYRQVNLWVPRKNGKTEFAGATSLLHLLGDGEPAGELYAIATKEDQARIVFDAASRMVPTSRSLSAKLEVYTTSIFYPGNLSSFKPLSGKPDGEHGKGASVLIGDEVHEWKDSLLYTFLVQGMGARRQPIEWLISTAGLTEGFGWEHWSATQAIASGVLEDPHTLVVTFAADPDDDVYDPEVWRKANPNYGVSVKESYFKDAALRAKRSPRELGTFKRYHLNIWTGQVSRWIDMEKWAKGNGKGENAWQGKADQLVGRKCFGGGDFASVLDLCSVGLLFPPCGGGTKWEWLPRFWMPRGDLESDLIERVRYERVPYDTWESIGAITLTDGNAADHDAICEYIIECHERYDVQGFGADPWNAHQLLVDLSDAGVDVLRIPQTIAGVTSACKFLERLVVDSQLDHGGHPVLRWNANNVVIQKDTKDNFMPNKQKSTQKIDGIVAGVNALAVACVEQGDDEIDLTYLEALG